MKITSLKTYYQNIIRNIKVLTGYTEAKYLEFLIKSCQLRPYDYHFNNVNKKVILHRKWFDNYGNSLNLEGKEIKILFGDTCLVDKKISSLDFYENLDIIKTRKISKLMCFLDCEILGHQIFLLSFLGIDDYLRTFCIIGDDVKKISSLFLGNLIIKQIFENIKEKHFKEIKIKKNIIPPGCNSAKGWIVALPAHTDFKSLVGKNYEQLTKIVG